MLTHTVQRNDRAASRKNEEKGKEKMSSSLLGGVICGAKGLSMNNVCTLARAPGGQMRGAAPLRAAARRPAGFVARSLHTTPGMLVARASPAGLGASSKV